MNKRVISAVMSLAILATSVVIPMTAQAAEAKTPQYQTNARQMEELNRGLIAVYRTADGRNVQSSEAGVYLSWRLLGDESLVNQRFDIYKNNEATPVHTTDSHDATNWIDTDGKASDTYKVVKAGANPSSEKAVTPAANHVAAQSQYTNLVNSFTYMDISLERPADNNGGKYYTVDKNTEGGANDASVGDLDGDGDYEIVLKWDPTNSKDAAGGGATGRTYIDAYEIDPSNNDPSKNENGHLYKWRIDLGPHVRSGAHENPFLVYDFDGDGKAEVVSITGLGATDSKGEYVTKAGDTEEIKNADNTKTYLRKGKNIGPEYYTIFDGETGEAICTTDAIPIGPNKNEDGSFGPEDGSYFGDAKMNRSSRYLAAVAYLDGVHPSIVMCRGYYNRAMIRAYTWDGTEMAMQWEHNGDKKGPTLYGQGNHNLSIGDIDDDGKDEIVYGSAALDDDGKTVLGNTQLGHGDAMHMSDFNNDGIQEVFSVKEDGEGFKKYAEDFRVAKTGEHFWAEKKIVTSDDNGRGVMDNIDDEYAKTHPNALALGWSSGKNMTHDFNGDDVAAKPASAGNGSFDNSLVYWDGDLSRELLDANIIQKYDAANGYTTRFWGESDGYTLTGGTTNNYSKRNASLTADLWGDWREEIIMPTGKGQNDTPALRIYTSTIPTEYRLTTLMHDCQYRLAIAWQNVAYNQPPHQSYYIGSAALASDENGNTLNYLAPAVPYTKVTYDPPAQISVEGIEITNKEITLENGKTATIDTVITPENATRKSKTWISSDTSVATVSNGIVKAVGSGKATITVTTNDGGFSDTCEITVFETPVEAVGLDKPVIDIGLDNSTKLTATVMPQNATDKTVKWSSENSAVAKVGADGTVTGVSYGKTKIIATTNNGGKTAECIVNVKPIDFVDATGSDIFVISNTLDDKVKFTGTSNSALLTLNEATSFVEFHKDFEAIDKNTATLSFHFTTGGAKTTDYIWKLGHEYNTELKFLDTNGNKIFDIIEQHLTSGNTTYYSVGDGGWQKASDWKKVSGDADNPWNRSQIRWDVKVTFDYAADTGKINLAGCNSSWERGATYETTFPLNGVSFKTLKYETNTIKDWVSGNPKLEQLSYTSTEQVSGNTDALYEKGTEAIAWQETDLSDWTQTGMEIAELALDADNGRIWYNATNPGADYSAEKTFDVQAGAVLSYDIDWYFGSAVARDGNYEYLQIGDKLRLGWTNGYNLYLSTDGGTTYGETAIFTGENTTYTKNVKAMFDTAAHTVMLSLDGTQIYSGTYSDSDEVTADGANLVKFGFTRAGAPPAWAVPNGISKIRVAQFIEGEETPDINCLRDIAVDETDAKTVNFKYGLVDNFDAITVVAALYNDAKELVELKTEVVNAPTNGQYIPYSMTFENDIDKNENVKVFVWNSLNSQEPIAYIMQ